MSPATELARRLGGMPSGYFVTIRVEHPESGTPILTACLFREPPEDGWPNRAAYFRHEARDDDAEEEFPWKYAPGVISGISLDLDDAEQLWVLLDGLIRDHLPDRP
jgi:hypothetical protein